MWAGLPVTPTFWRRTWENSSFLLASGACSTPSTWSRSNEPPRKRDSGRTKGTLAERSPLEDRAWTEDISGSQLPGAKAAREAGIKAAFAFPVLVRDEVVAVLEFFCDEFQEPDESLLELMAGIGTQLGRVVERKRARDEIDRFFTLSLDMLGIAGFDGYFKRVNTTLCETLGYSEEEMLTTPYLDMIHPDDLAASPRRSSAWLRAPRPRPSRCACAARTVTTGGSSGTPRRRFPSASSMPTAET